MPETPPSPTDLDDAAYQRALAILVDVGTSLALELKAASPDLSIVDRANAFERVALPVRRAIILSRHIAETPTAARAQPLHADTRRTMQRRQVIRAVDDTIEHKADPADAGALRRELLERVETLDFDTDLTHRQPADIIRDLCRDLGLADIPGLQTFPRRTPEDIARLNAQAAALPKEPPPPPEPPLEPSLEPPLEPSPAGGRGQGEGGAPSRRSPSNA